MRGFARSPAPIWLSVCLIVKNEEQRLGQCLESIRSLADEIIVVDTGSSDRTISIAKKYRSRIFKFEWCDDFSQVRNYAIAQAKGKWILVIDADEVLEPKAIATLRKVMQQEDCLAANLLRSEIGAKQAPYSLVLRLFRNDPAIAFRGIYHESIDSSVTILKSIEPHWQIVNVETLVLQHYGYIQVNLNRKYEFAKRLMHKHLESFPKDTYMLNKLGAFYVSDQSISDPDNISFGIGLLEKGLALIDVADSQNLTRCELYYHLGIAYERNHDLELAKNAYQSAIALDVPEIVKLSAYFNLGHIYQQDNQQEAIALLGSAIKIAPDFAQAHFSLGLALKTSGNFVDAIAAYRQAIAITPDYAEAHQNLGVVLIKVGFFQEAISSFELAIALHEQQNNFEIAETLRLVLQEIQD